MGVKEVFLGEDIVLDEEAFLRAIEEFAELGNQLQSLRNDVTEMLNDLHAGFNTPAGNRFIAACEHNLFIPLDEQKKVIDHISDTLKQAKQKYESVFREYESLQNTINHSNS